MADKKQKAEKVEKLRLLVCLEFLVKLITICVFLTARK